jgi:hypothetical protein
MFTRTVERELVGSHLEPFMRKFGGFDFMLLLDQNIIHATAPLTDKMLMSFDQRIETLQPAHRQDLEFFVNDEFL